MCVEMNISISFFFFLFFSRTDSSIEKIRVDNNNGKNNRSSTGSRSKLEDDSEKQLEMHLLESPMTEINIQQPKKKEVTILDMTFFLTILILFNQHKRLDQMLVSCSFLLCMRNISNTSQCIIQCS